MAVKNGIYNSYDLEAAKILNDFLPDKIFDVHAHLYDADFVSGMAMAAVPSLSATAAKCPTIWKI